MPSLMAFVLLLLLLSSIVSNLLGIDALPTAGDLSSPPTKKGVGKTSTNARPHPSQHAPVLEVSTRVGYVDELAKPGSLVRVSPEADSSPLVIRIEDKDLPVNGPAAYEYILAGNGAEKFGINALAQVYILSNERLSSANDQSSLPYSYSLWVTAREMNTGPLRSSEPIQLTIHVLKANGADDRNSTHPAVSLAPQMNSTAVTSEILPTTTMATTKAIDPAKPLALSRPSNHAPVLKVPTTDVYVDELAEPGTFVRVSAFDKHSARLRISIEDADLVNETQPAAYEYILEGDGVDKFAINEHAQLYIISNLCSVDKYFDSPLIYSITVTAREVNTSPLRSSEPIRLTIHVTSDGKRNSLMRTLREWASRYSGKQNNTPITPFPPFHPSHHAPVLKVSSLSGCVDELAKEGALVRASSDPSSSPLKIAIEDEDLAIGAPPAAYEYILRGRGAEKFGVNEQAELFVNANNLAQSSPLRCYTLEVIAREVDTCPERSSTPIHLTIQILNTKTNKVEADSVEPNLEDGLFGAGTQASWSLHHLGKLLMLLNVHA